MAGGTPGDSSAFYLTIPSDISFYNNKLHDFRVKLAQPVELEGPWEVALTEIIYPVSNYNVHGGHFYIQTFQPSAVIFGKPRTKDSLDPMVVSIDVPSNHYANIHELIPAIRESYISYWERRKADVMARELSEEDKNTFWMMSWHELETPRVL